VDHINCLTVIVHQKNHLNYPIPSASPHDLPFLSGSFSESSSAKLAANNRFDFLDRATVLGCMFYIPSVPAE